MSDADGELPPCLQRGGSVHRALYARIEPRNFGDTLLVDGLAIAIAPAIRELLENNDETPIADWDCGSHMGFCDPNTGCPSCNNERDHWTRAR